MYNNDSLFFKKIKYTEYESIFLKKSFQEAPNL